MKQEFPICRCNRSGQGRDYVNTLARPGKQSFPPQIEVLRRRRRPGPYFIRKERRSPALPFQTTTTTTISGSRFQCQRESLIRNDRRRDGCGKQKDARLLFISCTAKHVSVNNSVFCVFCRIAADALCNR